MIFLSTANSNDRSADMTIVMTIIAGGFRANRCLGGFLWGNSGHEVANSE